MAAPSASDYTEDDFIDVIELIYNNVLKGVKRHQNSPETLERVLAQERPLAVRIARIFKNHQEQGKISQKTFDLLQPKLLYIENHLGTDSRTRPMESDDD